MLPENYDPQKSALLANVCALTYTQYDKGVNNQGYDGTIDPPEGYRQIQSFTAPELTFTNKKAPLQLIQTFATLKPDRIDLTNQSLLADLTKGLSKVYFGFALEAKDGSHSIFALRGTREPFEWLMDAAFVQVPVPLIWFKDGRFGMAKAHFGFLFLYAFLVKQILDAARRFASNATCYVTGHSLGGALATLTALALVLTTFPSSKTHLYNYASPRVGDLIFCDAYNFFVPCSYRIVNLSDIVPLLPPEKIEKYVYRHIGQPDQEWSYVEQNGDILKNHSLESYASGLSVASNMKRTYPTAGLLI